MAKKKELNKELSIEASFKAIDKIISDMDSDNCSIEKSIELYENGMKLLNDVNKKIDKIEKNLKIISK